MHEYTVQITDVEKKALETNMVSIPIWFSNVIHNKARMCIDAVCKKALEEEGVLDEAARAEIKIALDNESGLMPSLTSVSQEIKNQIVLAAQVKTAVERNAEILASN